MENEMIDPNLKNFIYKKSHLQLAAFFGGPLAIVYILAENFRQLGFPEKIKKTWVIGIFCCLLFFAGVIALQLNVKTQSFLPSLISIFIGTAVMQSWQGEDMRHHIDLGGNIYPFWRALLIGLISLLLTVILIVFILIFMDSILGLHLIEKNK